LAGAEKSFARIADLVCLSGAEKTLLVGDGRDEARLVAALEAMGAALDRFGSPAQAAVWFREKTPIEPFGGKSPLALIAAEGLAGLGKTLVILRARRART